MSRNRIIYQSKAIYISPNATGVQMAYKNAASASALKNYSPTQTLDNDQDLTEGTGLCYKLDRVQNVNFGFTINAQDVNEMGKLARLSRISNEPPTVNLDFSYYLTDGLNERLMGFNFGGTDNGTSAGAGAWDTEMVKGANCMSGFLEETQGQNYYVVTTDEGEDVVGATLGTTENVIAFGNGFLTNYEINATVGELPTANVSIEAFNIQSDTNGTVLGLSGVSPAINTNANPASAFTSTDSGRYYNLNAGLFNSNVGAGAVEIAALRPGDITVSTEMASGSSEEFVVWNDSDENTMKIQSVSFSLPLARTTLNRLGSFFGYARVVDVPLNMEVTVSAFAVDFNNNQNVYNLLCGTQSKRNFTVKLNNCADAGSSATTALSYQFKGAQLVSENHSADIGGNETVDLTYSIQIGGANDTTNGVFMSGSYTTGYNSSLEAAYPYGGTAGSDYSGFGVLLTEFFKVGAGRNY